MPPAGTWPAVTPLLFGSMSPTTQRMPPVRPSELSSITNNTSAAVLAGRFFHSSGGLMPAPSQVYSAGISSFSPNAGSGQVPFHR